MYYEEFATSAKEQNENEMFVRSCNAAGYVYNLTVGNSSHCIPQFNRAKRVLPFQR